MAQGKGPANHPTRTTLQPTDWLNLFVGTNPANPEGGATDFKAQLSALSAFVLGNISVIENAQGQWNARIPTGATGGIQIDVNPNGQTNQYGNNGRLVINPTGNNEFLRPFSRSVTPSFTLDDSAAAYTGVSRFNLFKLTFIPTTTGVSGQLRRVEGDANFDETSQVRQIRFVAIGRY